MFLFSHLREKEKVCSTLKGNINFDVLMFHDLFVRSLMLVSPNGHIPFYFPLFTWWNLLLLPYLLLCMHYTYTTFLRGQSSLHIIPREPAIQAACKARPAELQKLNCIICHQTILRTSYAEWNTHDDIIFSQHIR